MAVALMISFDVHHFKCRIFIVNFQLTGSSKQWIPLGMALMLRNRDRTSDDFEKSVRLIRFESYQRLTHFWNQIRLFWSVFNDWRSYLPEQCLPSNSFCSDSNPIGLISNFYTFQQFTDTNVNRTNQIFYND